MENIIEFLGMVFSMLGAFYMSRNSEKNPLTMLNAGIMFLIANIFMIFVAIQNNLNALGIQMVLFYMSSVLIIYSYKKDKRTLVVLSLLSIVIFTLIIKNLNFNIVESFKFGLDFYAASMAITGSFILKSKNERIKIVSFILFFVADALYAYIGYQKSMPFFTIQSLFFLITSSYGIKNSLHVLNNKTSQAFAI